MSQISVELNPELEHALAEYMKLRHIETEAEAIRVALRELVERARPASRSDFSRWLGLGLQVPENPAPRFHSDHDLWA
jgi:metal-responsive CopG/Arc/MetJ family transcriptional regulator